MPFLQNNYENIKETGYEPLPTGVYECVINKASERATKNGAESLQLDLVVRNDLDGVPELSETNAKYHNRHVFMDNWKRKATRQFDFDGLMTIVRSAGEPNGKQYPSIDDYTNALYHKPIKVYIKKTENTYNGKTTEINQIAPFNTSKTAYPQLQHEWAKSKSGEDLMDDAINSFGNSNSNVNRGNNQSDPFAGGDQIDITDDDLPF